MRQSHSQAEATFADLRNYIYQGKKIDQQVHLGYDLAVTQHVGVEASNDGRVVWAAPLGIYGNCIVVDHGYGLQTIYGHLSQIDVHEGDMVKRGQVMGLSGMTGMAGGDHIHFAMQLDGVQIDPKEWWDPHWIQDHIAKRVELPGFQASAAPAAGSKPSHGSAGHKSAHHKRGEFVVGPQAALHCPSHGQSRARYLATDWLEGRAQIPSCVNPPPSGKLWLLCSSYMSILRNTTISPNPSIPGEIESRQIVPKRVLNLLC